MRFYVFESEQLTLATYRRNSIYLRINIGLFENCVQLHKFNLCAACYWTPYLI